MTNTTKNTTKSIFLALSVALSIGTASAALVPGLPGGLFEANGASFDVNGGGANAITNINEILTAVGTTSGSNINNTKFWQSFVEDEKTQTFDYNAAAPFIQELVYTVLGEAESAAGYQTGTSLTALDSNISRVYSQSELEQQAGFKVGDVNPTGTVGSSDEFYTLSDVETETGLSTTIASAGKYIDGNIRITGQNAVKLLAALDFTVADGSTTVVSSANFGAVNCANPDASTNLTGCATSTSNTDANVLNTNVSLQKDFTLADSPVNTTGVSTTVLANGGNNFLTKVTNAELNETAFINANLLISKIADQLKNGYILDVAAATAAVTQVIGHHNAFLGASIVDTAHDIKATIKVMGLQVAAAEVGKAAELSCDGTGQSIEGKACVAIGSKFQDILSDIGTINSATVASDYNDALDVISGFANDLIAFNDSTVAGNYGDGSAADASIDNQFGTITVVPTGSFYDSLVANDPEFVTGGTGNPVTSADWTTDASDGIFDLEDFDAGISINGDIVELH